MGKTVFRCLCALLAILFASYTKEGPLDKMEHIKMVGNDHPRQALASCSTPLRKTKSPPENEGTRRAGDSPFRPKTLERRAYRQHLSIRPDDILCDTNIGISFLQQGNVITPINIPLLRILDALRLIKEIPACSPDECLTNIRKTIDALSMDLKRDLADLSLAYTPYVRALLGAIYESLGLETEIISKSLNGVTSYKLSISDSALPNKRNWNIT